MSIRDDVRAEWQDECKRRALTQALDAVSAIYQTYEDGQSLSPSVRDLVDAVHDSMGAAALFGPSSMGDAYTEVCEIVFRMGEWGCGLDTQVRFVVEALS